MSGVSPKIERVKPPKWFVRFAGPLMRGLAARSKTMSRYMMVLHFTGAKTGRDYQVPIGYRTEGGRLMTLSNDVWRLNFKGGRDLEVTHLRQRRHARATLETDHEALADFYVAEFGEIGVKKVAADLGMRVNIDRAPTREEWVEALQREGMNRIWIDLDPT
jgi:hypothetical protein